MSNDTAWSRQRDVSRSVLQGMVRLYKAGQEPVYGEALNRALHGFGYPLSPGSLYPLLHSLERRGLLRCRVRIVKGRVRKYYELTAQGRSCLDQVRKDLGGLVAEVMFESAAPPCRRLF